MRFIDENFQMPAKSISTRIVAVGAEFQANAFCLWVATPMSRLPLVVPAVRKLGIGKMKICKILQVTLSLLTPVSANAQSDMAEQLCSTYIPVIRQGLYLRDQGVPLDIALNMTDSAYDISPRLYEFVGAIMSYAYDNPTGVEESLNDGIFLTECTKYVRGY